MRISDIIAYERQDAPRAESALRNVDATVLVVLITHGLLLLLLQTLFRGKPQFLSQNLRMKRAKARELPEDLWCIRSQW